MANLLPNLLSQLENDEIEYFLVKGKELIFNKELSFLQNDNNSHELGFILPTTLAGKELDETYDVYIDYLDGKEKPGCVANHLTYEKIYDDQGNMGTVEKYDPKTATQITTEINEATVNIPISSINNDGIAIKDNKTYYIETNVRYSDDGEHFISNVKRENFEDSAEVSKDYPSGYANHLYFTKVSKYLQTSKESGETTDGGSVNYFCIKWTLDNQVTKEPGQVTFSLRIEKESEDFKWQSTTANFRIIRNLKEYYYLQNEVEENYVIQNRKITPVGNFENILVKGDANSNKLFYKMNRYFQGQDMLAEKNIKIKNKNNILKEFSVKKILDLDGDIPFVVEDEGKYYTLNTKYIVNSAVFVGPGNKVFEMDSSGQITITIPNAQGKEEKYTFSNLSVKKIYNKTKYGYEYQISWTAPSGYSTKFHTIFSVSSLDTPLNILNSGDFTITPILNLTGTNFELNISQTFEKTISNRVVPMFNRLIRFVFADENGEYGDFNDGEIEYINENDNYFIFSWTPDSRATRAEGELNYCIEFYINSIENLLNIDGSITTVNNRTYSWSTLPSTITIENNFANTANLDYIPSWTSYIENDIMGVLNQYIATNIQSQYNSIVDTLMNRFLAEYSTYENQDKLASVTRETEKIYYIGSITLKNEKYTLEISTSQSEGIVSPDTVILYESTHSESVQSFGPSELAIIPNATNKFHTNIIVKGIYYYVIYNFSTQQIVFYSLEEDNGQPLVPFIKNVLEDELQNIKNAIFTNGQNFSELTIDQDGTEQHQSIERIIKDLITSISTYFFASGLPEDNSVEAQLQTKFSELSGLLLELYDNGKGLYLTNKEEYSDKTAQIDTLPLGGELENCIQFDYKIDDSEKSQKCKYNYKLSMYNDRLHLYCTSLDNIYVPAARYSTDKLQYTYPQYIVQTSNDSKYYYECKSFDKVIEYYYYKTDSSYSNLQGLDNTLLIYYEDYNKNNDYSTMDLYYNQGNWTYCNIQDLQLNEGDKLYKINPVYSRLFIAIRPTVYVPLFTDLDLMSWPKPTLISIFEFPEILKDNPNFSWEGDKIPILVSLVNQFNGKVTDIDNNLTQKVNQNLESGMSSLTKLVLGEPNENNNYSITTGEDEEGNKQYTITLSPNFSIENEAIQNSLIRQLFNSIQGSLDYYTNNSTNGALATIYSQYIAQLNENRSTLTSQYEASIQQLSSILQAYSKMPQLTFDGSILNVTTVDLSTNSPTTG